MDKRKDLGKEINEEIEKVLENPSTLWFTLFKPDGILNTKERLEAYIRQIDETIENESDQSKIGGLIKFREVKKWK